MNLPKLKWFIQHALWPFALASFGFLFLGLYLVFFVAPVDVTQGAVMRILYIHVPCAWLSMFVYSFMSVLSFFFLIFRWPVVWPFIEECLTLGQFFTFLALATGSIWGQSTWGAWWVWDARLTSMLALLLIYFAAAKLFQALKQGATGRLVTATFILVGAINLPIIHFSVQWWHTLHQGSSVLHFQKPTIDMPLFVPLMVMASAHIFLFAFLLSMGVEQKLRASSRGLPRQGRGSYGT